MGGKRKRGANKAVANTNGTQPIQKRPKIDHPPTNGDETNSLELDKSPFTEEKVGENRKREARIYELLGSADSDERIAAADALVTALLAGTESVLERHLDKRLFRGLASSRNASRLGFSLVLTEILAQLFGPKDLANAKYPSLTFEKVLGILINNTKPSGNIPGQEERDLYFGRLFGIQCFVEAKILFDDETRWPKVLDLLLQMADKKVWMRSHCGWVIVESLPQMGQARAEQTLQKLSDIGLGKTAEGIGMWMRARSSYPNMKIPTKPWQDPMSPAVLPEVARVLKENVAQDTGEDKTVAKIKQSNWTAQLHFVWDLILQTFTAQREKGKKQGQEQFKLFWTTVIDDGLFSKNASDGQKFRGFMIFQKFLHGFSSGERSLVKELFSRNLMKCLMNQASKEDRYLHRAALKSLQSIEKAVESSPELLIPILEELLGKLGAYDFDQRTNSKTVENLLQWATPTNAGKVLKLLRKPVTVMDDNAPNDAEKLRQAYSDYVFKLAVQSKQEPEDSNDINSKSGLEVGIRELASCAYSTQDEFKPSLSEKSRELFRKRLASAFAKVTKQRNNAEYLCKAVVAVEPTAIQMSEEIETERHAAIKAMQKLLKNNKKSDDKQGASLGLALLYAATILQLYDGAPDAINILQDLKSCSEKMKTKEAGTSELLVEILLALVSRHSTMMRQISEQVFEAFTSHISSEALELLTEPLQAEENSTGYQALFENMDDEDVDMEDADKSGFSDEDEDANEDEDEDEISELGSDVEFVTLNGAELADGDEGDEEESEDDAEAEAKAKDLADLDDALAKVLKSHRLDQDKDAESSDNDSDMTDSEMMALDPKLIEVFKQRAKASSKKKDRKDAKESIITFKHRILDLLHIYVKHEASRNPLSFHLLLPLLGLVRTTTAKPLANKALGVLADFSKAAKKKHKAPGGGNSKEEEEDPHKQQEEQDVDVDADAEAQFALLEAIVLREAPRDPSHAFARAASTAALLVASRLLATDPAHAGAADRVNALYARALSAAQRGEVRVQGAFFADWVNWAVGYASNAQQHQQQKQSSG
ncbi:DNA polymerase phi-domain-containing protein [Biscogniauxia mediterranea]|nr:DNA polymerase phi-domain-containing protein [Biscogniauxia mediterranea]